LREKESTFEFDRLRIVRRVLTEENVSFGEGKDTGLEESQGESIGDPRKSLNFQL